jgi:hypothetical protein
MDRHLICIARLKHSDHSGGTQIPGSIPQIPDTTLSSSKDNRYSKRITMVIIKAMGNPISKTRVTSRDVHSGLAIHATTA